jgi:hypothetical protein
MAATTPVRPRLVSRAISDMNPLMCPSPSADKKDLGQGTQATSGGAKVISGARTALGGIAPLSPFLPLPPAPTSEELQRQCSQDKAFLNIMTPKAASHVRFASSLENEAAGKKTRAAILSNAPHMIRSYSMPVATQRDYEVQREILRRRQQEHTPIKSSSVALQPESNSAHAMATSVSSMGGKHQLYSNDFSDHRKAAKVSNSPLSPSRSPLSIISYNEMHSRNDSNEVDMDSSGSDEAEVLTPRALSPATDYFTKASSAPPFDDLSMFIHPSHLQPPPGLSL